MVNYDLLLTECCRDVTQSLYFAMFLTNRQTDEELNSNETIEDNNIGWNKPDSYMSSTFLLLLQEFESTGKITVTIDHRKFHTHKLSKVLAKYKKQYKQYCSKKPFKFPVAPVTPKQYDLF